VDAGCRNTVYNEVAQSALEYIPGMKRLGVEWFRLEFLHEKPETVLKTMNVYRDVLAEKKDPKHAWREIRANNQFGLTRGTLRLL
jgi:putative protease